GEREARTAQQMDPMFHLGFVSLAFGQLGQGQVGQAAETYQKLEKLSPLGASYAQAGMGDLALYEGRFEEAVRAFEGGVNADLAAKYADRAAAKLAMIAYTRLLQNQKPQALAAARRALEVSKIPRIKFLAGRIFAEGGDTPRAKS